MAKVAVYDKEGNEYFKEPIDAIECCDILGYVMELPEKVKEEKPKQTRKAKPAIAAVAPAKAGDK